MRRFFLTLGIGLTCGLLAGMALAGPPQDAIDLSSSSARVHQPAAGQKALTGPSTAAPAAVARDFLAARGPGATVARDMALTREHRGLSGVTHLRFQQHFAGLPVYGAYAKVAVDSTGRVVHAVENLVQPRRGLQFSRIGPEQALQASLELNFPGQDVPQLIGSQGNTYRFERGSFFHVTPTVERVAIAGNDGRMAEGFLTKTWSQRGNLLYHTVVNGQGEVVYHQLRTNTDSYNIFPEEPLSTPQEVVAGPGSGNTESPNGWLFSGDQLTINIAGNNVNAYLDTDANNAPDPGGTTVSDGNFLTNADLTQEPDTSENQEVAVQNLFYFNNVIHDKLYQHGFVESVGNFQEDNFGNGGSGSDSVLAEAQDGSGTNNANFATPSDGSNPRMQMFIWTQSTPNRDGDVDSDIIWHEYGHGLTWRMIGNMSGPLAGAIGEGMSDTLSIYINLDDVLAEYSFNDPGGIRRFPYTDYPLTYGDVTGDSVHADGEIYAGTMWHLLDLWESSGRTQDELFDYVIDGMNFTPSQPAYEDMRDGILAATPTQDEQCIVWQAFADFGIGEGASGEVSGCNPVFCQGVSITESFTVPSECDGTTNSPPTASFTFTCTDLSCDFDGTGSSDSDGTISSYDWDFGDGNTGTGSTVSHTFGASGDYTVTLTVTDDGGATDSDSQVVSVSDGTNAAPTAAFTFACTDLACDFDGSGSSDSDGTISSYDWNFGDGNIGSGVTVSHTYAAGGTYTVTLTVTDDDGATDSDSQDVTVTEPSTGDITLSAIGYKVRGLQKADLTWSGATSNDVDVYRDGVVITTTANDGFHTDNIDLRGPGSYTYQVCEAGTSTCSNEASVTF